MLCIEFEEHLTEYLEGMLAAQVRTACHEHILRCPACHDLTNEVKASLEACRSLPTAEPSTALQARILKQTAPHNLMTCGEFEEHLTDYLDGFLPASVFHRWERHAAMCRSCDELPGLVVRSIGACYTSLQNEMEMPAHLHSSILQATIGTTNAHELQAPLRARVLNDLRRWFDVAFAPQLITVATMILVAILFGTTTISDDGSVLGMYRAGINLARESSARSVSSAAQNRNLPEDLRRAAQKFADRVNTENAVNRSARES